MHQNAFGSQALSGLPWIACSTSREKMKGKCMGGKEKESGGERKVED